MEKKKVVVAMSGGVDSSVSAYLLKKEGHDIIGATMQLTDDENTKKTIEDAKKICDILGIKHYVYDLRKEFKNVVIDYFIKSYENGKTPNPCVMCNKYFKFGLFYEKSKELGYDNIATGHYAKIENGQLKFSSSLNKDQSYFLWGINKKVLDHIIFPLSNFKSKDEVREIAKKANLFVFSKKDSQEVCFVPNDDYKTFLSDKIKKPQQGNICLKDGTVLGKHDGLINYTIGQRKGLNISYKEPLYVLEINTKDNLLIVGNNEDLYKDELLCDNINLFIEKFPKTIYAKVRSRGLLKEVTIEKISDSELKVKFKEKERAITSGQSVVFYDENKNCIGGGIIK